MKKILFNLDFFTTKIMSLTDIINNYQEEIYDLKEELFKVTSGVVYHILEISNYNPAIFKYIYDRDTIRSNRSGCNFNDSVTLDNIFHVYDFKKYFCLNQSDIELDHYEFCQDAKGKNYVFMYFVYTGTTRTKNIGSYIVPVDWVNLYGQKKFAILDTEIRECVNKMKECE